MFGLPGDMIMDCWQGGQAWAPDNQENRPIYDDRRLDKKGTADATRCRATNTYFGHNANAIRMYSFFRLSVLATRLLFRFCPFALSRSCNLLRFAEQLPTWRKCSRHLRRSDLVITLARALPRIDSSAY